MKKRIAIISITIALAVLLALGAVSVFADSDPILSIEAEYGILGGNANISGYKVGNLGRCGGDNEGTVTFIDLEIPEDGTYALLVYYCSGSDDRYFDIGTDKDMYKLDCPNTGSFDTVGTIVIEVELEAGGTLIFGSDWYGPDLDRVEIYKQGDLDFDDKDYNDTDEYIWQKILKLDTKNGVYSLLSSDKVIIENAHAEVKIDGTVITSDEFANHEYVEDKDNKTITFKHKDHPSFDGELNQIFYLKSGYLTTEVTVSVDGGEISTNYISPMSTYKNSINIDNAVFLQMPFDNDKWVEPKFIAVKNLGRTTFGYEVGVFYDEKNMSGLVIGSVEHDVWKTGITVYSEDNEIAGVDLYGGAADSNTRDIAPHGMVSGETVKSPLMFLGFFDNWQNGLVAYGKANTDVVPAKQSVTKVPFGYNSWGSLQSGVKYSDMINVSNYIKENLQEIWNEDEGTVYVNIDSFWDYIVENDPSCNLTLDEALAAFVKCCNDNGQKAGIYYTPFACWHSSEADLKNSKMEGSNYTYYDAAMRNGDGSALYGQLAGGFALDPTHPGTIARIEDRMNYFIELGFKYIKLDFMTHGAVEGQHYDKNITTGMQAYNYGMAKIHEICNGKMYVNLSIAPVFPYQYADGRRISCDAFASIDNTKHVLSYLSACFWHKEIYSYPDPDHIVVLGSDEGAARCRVTSGVISGTSFLIGDNLNDAGKGTANYNMIMKMFGNKDIISVAKLGKAFKPLTVNGGDRCADAYWYKDGDVLYFAVFNFDSGKPSFDLSSIVGNIPEGVVATDLWRGIKTELDGSSITCLVPKDDAAIYKIELKNVGGSTETDAPSTEALTQTPAGTETLAGTEEPSGTEQPSNNGTVVIIAVIAAVVIIGAVVAVIIIKKKK